MNPSTDINQDPLTANDTGATSFAPDFDMSAINEAVAAGGETPNIQNTFDVDDIDLDNTPTTDKELEQQLAENPDMSLANSADSPSQADDAADAPKTVPAASFVDGDLVDESSKNESAPESAPELEAEKTTVADLANSLSSDYAKEEPVATDAPAPSSSEQTEPAAVAQPTAISASKKSKLPMVILIIVAVIAVAAVAVTLVLAMKK